MPAVRRYRVREEREVLVTASSPAEAVVKGNDAFRAQENGQEKAVGVSEIRSLDISATED